MNISLNINLKFFNRNFDFGDRNVAKFKMLTKALVRTNVFGKGHCEAGQNPHRVVVMANEKEAASTLLESIFFFFLQ